MIEYVVIAICIFALIHSSIIYHRLKSMNPGTKKMQAIARHIKSGAMAFLRREYQFMSFFIIAVAIILYLVLDDAGTVIHEGFMASSFFILGAVLSIYAGYRGMQVATDANDRTAYAVRLGILDGLKIAFASGSIMGITVVAVGLLGISVLYSLTVSILDIPIMSFTSVITSFGMGASSIALFARVGGGIYTKAADVGADLVGKVESNIEEDDPRNPAVIADNVGDNVGDVSGMGADLFESFVSSIIAATAIGVTLFGVKGFLFPMMIAAAGLVSAMVGALYVKLTKELNIEVVLIRGFLITSIIALIIDYFISRVMFVIYGNLISVLIGLVVGVIVGGLTEYYTSNRFHPVKDLANSANTGAATVIIEGLSLGFFSVAMQIVTLCVGIFLAYQFAGLYGIALTSVGMLSTLGFTLAVDAYGPVADTAGGIAQMAKMGKKVRDRTDQLDAVGNSTAAIGKGFAISSAALTALALFSAFIIVSGVDKIDIMQPEVIIGIFVGGMLAFLFAALTMRSVGRVASLVIVEARRQFTHIEGLLKGKKEADYGSCVDIVTKGALRQMIAPGLIAIVSPIIMGLSLGAEALGGMLAGSLVTGVLLAITMANSGGAWDNAKKLIESGEHGGKGSDSHKASVVGDTVGDPFKDTAGPSLNILIKLMSIVSLVFVPLLL